jgi:hypothetical protein
MLPEWQLNQYASLQDGSLAITGGATAPADMITP